MTTETLMTEAANPTQGEASTTTQASATAAPAEGQQQAAPETLVDSKAEGTDTKAAETAPAVPEKYEFKLPDGVQMDDTGISAFSEYAKAQGLTQEAAQAQLEAMAPAMQAAQTARLEKAKTDWLEAAKTDKEFGGDAFSDNLKVADKALNELGTPELTKLLKSSGLNHHPEVIRLLVKAGKAMSEDSKVISGGNRTVLETTAQRMYPSMNP